MTINVVQEGDVGTIFEATLENQNGNAIDISATTVRRILLQNPSGIGTEYLATLPTGGADGKMQWVVPDASILTPTGPWKWQARVEWGDGQKFSTVLFPVTVVANISATVASSGVYPRMSMMPVTFDPINEVNFMASWAEMDALVGPDGWPTMLDTKANWEDVFHQNAIALIAGTRLVLQLSRSDLEDPVTEGEYLEKLKDLLDLYGDKIVAICLCIEANGGTNDILGADATGRRAILLAGHNYVVTRFPGIKTFISVAVQTAITAANWSTIMPNLFACGVHWAGATDYIDNGFTTPVDIDSIATRYDDFFAELTTAGATEFVVAEFGASSHRTFNDDTTVNVAQGEAIQAACLQRAHDAMVGNSAGAACRFFAYVTPYQQTWWQAAFKYHGATQGDDSTRKEMWAKWIELRDKYVG